MTKEQIGFSCSQEQREAIDALRGSLNRSAYIRGLIEREAMNAGLLPRMILDLKPIRVREAAGDEKT